MRAEAVSYPLSSIYLFSLSLRRLVRREVSNHRIPVYIRCHLQLSVLSSFLSNLLMFSESSVFSSLSTLTGSYSLCPPCLLHSQKSPLFDLFFHLLQGNYSLLSERLQCPSCNASLHHLCRSMAQITVKCPLSHLSPTLISPNPPHLGAHLSIDATVT